MTFRTGEAPSETNPLPVGNGQVVSQTAVIANGDSVSAAVDFGTGRLTAINMPAAWTAAALTFSVSFDGVTYRNLYGADGTEYTVQAAASRSIIVPLSDFVGVRYLKVRSGTSGTPVVQAARSIELVLVP